MIEELRTVKFFSSLFFFFFEREREIRDDACIDEVNRYLKLFQFYFSFLTICPTLAGLALYIFLYSKYI